LFFYQLTAKYKPLSS